MSCKTPFLVLCLLACAAHAAPRKKAPPKPPAPAEDLLTPLAPAPAPAPPPKVDSELVREGERAYDNLEYQKCVELLQKALGETLTRDEKVVTWKTLAFCHVGLDMPGAAQLDFENLLRIDDGFELDRRVSPRVRAPFEQAKAAIATGQSVEGEDSFRAKRVTPSVSPVRPVEGQPVTVGIKDTSGLGMQAELFYRTRGQAVFSKLSARGTPQGAYALTVPGLSVQKPALEYYLVVLDEQSTSVARAGSQVVPLMLDVTAKKTPVYKRGWFWGVIAGVVVAGAVVGGAVGGTLGAGPSSSTPASVTIMPH